MRKSISLTTLALVSLLAVGAGCETSNTSSTTRNSTEASAPVVKDYKVGEEVATGPITHKVLSVEQMDTIPSSATLPEWEIIAEDAPAAEGFTWLHIKGEVKNGSKEQQTLSTNGIYVVDTEGNEFEVSTDTTIYVDSDTTPVYMTIQPTQTTSWEGYFQVPSNTAGMKLMVNDLDYVPKTEAAIDLGL